MLARNWLSASLALAALLCSACSPGEAENIDQATSALVSANGTSLNGTSLNGTSLNGTSLNGISLNGTSLNGVTLAGANLHAFSPLGAQLEGTDLIGATLTGHTDSGSAVTLRINDIEESSDHEVYFYTVAYQSGAQWTSICGYDEEGAIPAIPLQGTWDSSAGTATGGDHIDSSSVITFACVGSTLAKCVDLGYQPWKTVKECTSKVSCQTRSLRPFHQACTRMLRADYCGDGTPHTVSNVPVNMWDNFKVQKQAHVGDDWKLEAEWTSEGAVCINELRYDPDSATSDYVAERCPGRLSASFSCFGDDSTFFTAYGYTTPLPQRSVLRMEFDYDYVYDLLNGAY